MFFINQGRPFVECYTRAGDNEWRLAEARGIYGVVVLEARALSLPLTDLYRDLTDGL